MEAQEDEAEGDESKLPDPEFFTVQLDHGPDDGIGLPSLQVQNDHGEQGIKNVQSDDQYKQRKEGRTVPVDITTLFAIRLPAKVLPPPQEGVLAQRRGGLLSAVPGSALIPFLQDQSSSIRADGLSQA